MRKSGEAKLLIVMAIVAAVGIGAWKGVEYASNVEAKRENPPPKPPDLKWDAAKFEEAVKKSRHVEGPANATVSLIEFADFQCPSCRRAYNDTLSPLMKANKPVRIAFFHYPLTEMHQFAQSAAIASEAAAKQGKFWEMYKILFDGVKTELSEQYIEDCAKKAGLDMIQFKLDRTDSSLAGNVQSDRSYGDQLKVSSTPTFIMKDAYGSIRVIVGGKDLETEFKKLAL